MRDDTRKSFLKKMGSPPSLQGAASIEHLQAIHDHQCPLMDTFRR
jgi:hypothetical protein